MKSEPGLETVSLGTSGVVVSAASSDRSGMLFFWGPSDFCAAPPGACAATDSAGASAPATPMAGAAVNTPVRKRRRFIFDGFDSGMAALRARGARWKSTKKQGLTLGDAPPNDRARTSR